MLTKTLNLSEKVFDKLRDAYENRTTNKYISFFLVILFLSTAFMGFLVNYGILDLGVLNTYLANPLFSIEVPFVALLMFEIFSLIFVIPKSVSKSVGKQLELLSLIFIRGAFKEFSHIKNVNLSDLNFANAPEPIWNMVFYAFGSLIIFILLGFTNRMRKHTPFENADGDAHTFYQSKKLLSIFLIIAFIFIIIEDFVVLITTGSYQPSFQTFYTMLIFSDILILLIALRYSMDYYRIFRYSAFVVATIFIRLALSVEPFYNVLIGIFTAVFVMLLTLVYNYFLNRESKETKMSS
ncbi:hypothetical protein FEZ18_11090 [Oceanihabitans sp. IOP_32]|uniref:hypothetical protein n=1 Tax=Oceanihabitans sp. IOP_32 TaxID=2529032 RepID=UPI00129312B9|nr:hypothetical protein [Oceanihabitans sp. IOP_32]QFZ55311.1 hypothetical protein FEZ18_11090 [Oceanihabitans sp. IOP_32]